MAATFVGYVTACYYFYYDDCEYFWKNKFKADFDPFIENENMETINWLWPRKTQNEIRPGFSWIRDNPGKSGPFLIIRHGQSISLLI